MLSLNYAKCTDDQLISSILSAKEKSLSVLNEESVRHEFINNVR